MTTVAGIATGSPTPTTPTTEPTQTPMNTGAKRTTPGGGGGATTCQATGDMHGDMRFMLRGDMHIGDALIGLAKIRGLGDLGDVHYGDVRWGD